MRPGQCRGKHFHHQRQRRAFRVAERDHGAGERRVRVGCGPAVFVEGPTLRDWLALLFGRDDIAARTLDSARSMTIGVRPSSGAANAIGLVPNTARVPPQGAIASGVLAKNSATRPCSASRSTWRPQAPAWLEREIVAAAMSCCFCEDPHAADPANCFWIT